MKQRIVAIVIVSAALITVIGCGNAEPAQAEVVQEAEVTATEEIEEELGAQKEVGEAEKATEEEEANRIAAEEERIAALEEQICAILESKVATLVAEMTENGNTDGVSALNSLVDGYNAGEISPDAFMESYDSLLTDKEAFDTEYAAEQERISQEAKATEEAKKAEESKPAEEAKPVETKPAVTIPDWFDAAYYAANNADVVAALGSSPEALYNHYIAHGKGEGRAAYEGDPNAVAKAESPAPAGEPAQTEGGATTQTPWGDLYVIYGEGWDSYFISEGAPEYVMVDELSNRVSGNRAVDWIFLGEMNGKHIRKYYVRPL